MFTNKKAVLFCSPLWQNAVFCMRHIHVLHNADVHLISVDAEVHKCCIYMQQFKQFDINI